MKLAPLLLAATMLAGATAPAQRLSAPQLLDSFDILTPWQAAASDGVTSVISQVAGAEGQAMALDYDFGAVAGYAYAYRALPIDFPDNFALALKLRGQGGSNDLQIKFVDESGQNVWWYQRKDFTPTADWQTLHIRARDISFAWGPTADKALPSTARMEVVIVRGRDGGQGRIEMDDLVLTPKAPVAPPAAPSASAPEVLDGDPATRWLGKGGDQLLIDMGGQRLLGGVQLQWAPGEGASDYNAQLSDDGKSWREGYRATGGDGGRDPVPLPDSEAAFLRLTLPEGAPHAALSELSVEPANWAPDLNGFIASLAATAPRGTFPRGFTEQPYWTVVGTDGGGNSALIDEDGAIEPAKGSFSIVPYVLAHGKLFTWADVETSQSLAKGYLPIPAVRWQGPGWHLETQLVADETDDRLLARWRLVNDSDRPRTLQLLLGVRPFQVNPPAQFLSQQGGVSPIAAIEWNQDQLMVMPAQHTSGSVPPPLRLIPLVQPGDVYMAPFDRGALMEPGDMASATSVKDPHDLASATLRWSARLGPGEEIDIPMAIPHGAAQAPKDFGAFVQAEAQTLAIWAGKLDKLSLHVPEAKNMVADTLRTALAHVLISRDGPQLKPGTRSYNRSWIRDGAMMSDSLLRMGVVAPAREFADWYGGKLFDNGKVPCCVDYRGPDPVPENDAQGEYIHLLVQLYRYDHDRAKLASDWPRIASALSYMEMQRQSERTAENLIGDKRVRYGLMPPSISHEGYSAAPQYSLWDDFWALTGYKDAAFAAEQLGLPEAKQIAAQRDEFAQDIQNAIRAATERFDIDYIPGATSLGDFDATSTTIALDPAGELEALDPALLARTFDMQWKRVMARRDPDVAWSDYTPYELRNVSAFIRLGRRDEANALLDYYMADRRPAAWNGWAEVVGRNAREIRFIGDMPHAWVASDFIRAAFDMFAYERGSDRAIILGGGLTRAWLEPGGMAVSGIDSSSGTIDLAMRLDKGKLLATIAGSANPEAGFVLRWPLDGEPGRTLVDGKPVRWSDGGLSIKPTGKPIRISADIKQSSETP